MKLVSPKVYLAAPYPCRDQAIAVMERLETGGCVVTSTWLKSPDEMTDEFARLDLLDVARADILVALNIDGWEERGTGGRHIEFGYAIALGKPILLVGQRSNIFHHLSTVASMPNISDVDTACIRAVIHDARSSGITRDSAVACVLAEFSKAEAKQK